MSELMTRRSFLKKSLGFGAALLAVGSASSVLAGCAKAPSADLISTSSVDFNHSHKVTIPGADIDAAPASKTYKSDGQSHQHDITLVKANFQTLKKGGTVTAVGTMTGTTPHPHTWVLKMA